MAGLSGVTAMGAGNEHSLALRADGTAWAWGHNANGRLGDGTTLNRYTPVPVSWPTSMGIQATPEPH